MIRAPSRSISACVTVPSGSVWRSVASSRKPNARQSHPIAVSASSYASIGTIRCRVVDRSVVLLAPALEALAEIAQEAPGERAVDQAVVVRERQVHDRPDRDRVHAVLV